MSLQDGKETTDVVLGKLNVEAKGKITDYGITSFALSDAKLSTKGAPGAPTPMDAVKSTSCPSTRTGRFVLTGKINFGQETSRAKARWPPWQRSLPWPKMNKPLSRQTVPGGRLGFKFDS